MSNSPRINYEDIEKNIIVSEHYFTAYDGAMNSSASGKSGICREEVNIYPLGLLTFCVLVLRNGFTVTGESACVSHENFDSEIGCEIARQNAVEKMLPLMGYALKESLANR